MTNLDSVLKSKDITLLTKVCIVKAMVIPVVMYGCESRTMETAECQKTDAFKLWCWRRLLRVPWTARSSSQSVLKEINPEYSWKDWCWSWSSNALATYVNNWLIGKRPWWWERLKAEGGEGERGCKGWMTSLIQWTGTWTNSERWWGTEKPGVYSPWGLQRVRHGLHCV